MPINDWKEAALRLLKTDTSPSKGTKEIMPILEELLEGSGCNLTKQTVERGGVQHSNLIARRGEGPGGLLLLTHIDTDDPSPSESWTETGMNPFNPVIKDGKIYGFGSSDAKMDWLAKAMALQRLKQDRLREPLLFAATYGEQLGFLGARQLMASGEVRNRYALVAVPSGLNIIYSHKGYIVVRVRLTSNSKIQDNVRGVMPVTRIACRGKDAHSSQAHLGENAVLKSLHVLEGLKIKGMNLHIVAIDGGGAVNRVPDFCVIDVAGDDAIIDRINEHFSGEDVIANAITKVTEGADMSALLRYCKETWRGWNEAAELLQPKEDKAFDPPKVICNLSVARGTAERLEFVLDSRLLPEHDPEDMVTALDGLLRDMEYHHPDVKAEFEIIHLSRGLAGSEESDITKISLDTLKKLGVKGNPATIAGSTEAQIVASYNLDTVVFGPGAIEQVGSPNEFVPLEEIEKAAEFYEEIIKHICR